MATEVQALAVIDFGCGAASAAATARMVVDLPKDPTTATTRVLRAIVRRYSLARRDIIGQSR